ncbi:MAG: hypothetical protein M4579_004994 [Chaenotheca gracillima]|nr:MAG: hypothetical protein M4579_004994 [Chaenotheca gracillima]
MACASCAAQVLRASFSEAVLPRSAFQRHFSADTRAWRTPALQRWRTAPSTRRLNTSAARSPFGPTEAWQPRKRLSPDAVEGIRALHAQYPAQFTTPVLADRFKVSPEAIRRILKSKWRPNEEEDDDRRKRWNQRGEKIWTKLGELGVKPPRKWREAGVGRRRDDGPERRPRYPWTGPSDDADERGASRGRVGGRGREVDLDGEDLGDRIV